MNKQEYSRNEQKRPPDVSGNISGAERHRVSARDSARPADASRQYSGKEQKTREEKDLAEQQARAEQEGMTRHKQDNTPSPAPGSTEVKKRDNSRDDE